MKVYYTYASANKSRSPQKISKLIKNLGNVVVSGVNKSYQEISKSILASDVVIIENTDPEFSLGYQTAFALEKKKPVLLLHLKSKNIDYKKTFAYEVESRLLKHKVYSDDDIKFILQDFFIKNARGGKKTRFNFYLDDEIENYLDWASFTYKKNKAEIIRDLISDHMVNEDPRYKDYLLDE